jgi:NDP-sugar pyrophosphorylase family protein
MQAILMAGGKGSRLRPFTAILPKPLVPIGEISILEMVLRQLQYYGFRKIIITVGHKAELIMAVVGDGGRFGLDISYHYEEKPLGTMGALAYLDGLEDNFLVMNGDICTNMDFSKFYNDHIRGGAKATIGTYARCEKMELGVLTVDETGQKIVGFKEKPTYDFLVSMGVNALNKSIVELIPKGELFGFDDLMNKMLEKKIDVRSYQFDGLWHDIGMPEDYERMLQDFKGDPAAYLPEGA